MSQAHAVGLPPLVAGQDIVASEIRERAFGGAAISRKTKDQARFLCVEYNSSTGNCAIYQWILLRRHEKGYYVVANSAIRTQPAPATPDVMAAQLLSTHEYGELVVDRKLLRTFEIIELWKTCVFDKCNIPAPFVVLSIATVPAQFVADVATIPAKFIANRIHRMRLKGKIRRFLRSIRDNEKNEVFKFDQNVFEYSMPMLGI
ncbi:MAG: hypothetical protein JNL01_16860 [Bdellovibrionales bacterium]|nr:hypothetical protein [Bdellovibrionales bacterium]